MNEKKQIKSFPYQVGIVLVSLLSIIIAYNCMFGDGSVVVLLNSSAIILSYGSACVTGAKIYRTKLRKLRLSVLEKQDEIATKAYEHSRSQAYSDDEIAQAKATEESVRKSIYSEIEHIEKHEEIENQFVIFSVILLAVSATLQLTSFVI